MYNGQYASSSKIVSSSLSEINSSISFFLEVIYFRIAKFRRRRTQTPCLLGNPTPSPRIRKNCVMAFLRGSSIYCIGKEEIDVPKRVVFSSVCITTATISSFGAIVQLVNWYKKLRETEIRRVLPPTPHVVFSLALADLFTCLGKLT